MIDDQISAAPSPGPSLEDRRKSLKRSVEVGAIKAWEAALGEEWLATPDALMKVRPSAADLHRVVLDHDSFARLLARDPEGPWEILRRQALSHRAHEHFGRNLASLSLIQPE
jgi:hypothetical protein